jgi:ABC-type sulfate transport system permease component
VQSLDGGVAAFWDAITSAQAQAAIRLTLVVSLIVAAINAVIGTLIAWVLVYGQIESGNTNGAAAVSVLLLFVSFLVLLAISFVARRGIVR